MKLIELQNDLDNYACVDDEDFERLNAYRWLVNAKGYVVRFEGSSYNRHQTFMHNQVLNLPANSGVDHIDNHKTNNQKNNLRIVTHSVNQQNRKTNSRNTTGYKGVSFSATRKYGGKYKATLGVNGKNISIGYFKTPEEAANAYDKKAVEIYGPDALTNAKLVQEVVY